MWISFSDRLLKLKVFQPKIFASKEFPSPISRPLSSHLEQVSTISSVFAKKLALQFGVSGKLDDKQLIAALTKHAKEKFLFPVSDVHKDDIEVFEQYGIECTKAIMYRTVSNDFTPDEPFDYDMLIFFSPAGVNSLKKNFPDFNQGEIAIGCLGSATAQAVKDAGLRLDIQAPTTQMPSITAAIDTYLKSSNKKK